VLFAGLLFHQPSSNEFGQPVPPPKPPAVQTADRNSDCVRQGWPYREIKCTERKPGDSKQATRQVRVVPSDGSPSVVATTAAPTERGKSAKPEAVSASASQATPGESRSEARTTVGQSVATSSAESTERARRAEQPGRANAQLISAAPITAALQTGAPQPTPDQLTAGPLVTAALVSPVTEASTLAPAPTVPPKTASAAKNKIPPASAPPIGDSQPQQASAAQQGVLDQSETGVEATAPSSDDPAADMRPPADTRTKKAKRTARTQRPQGAPRILELDDGRRLTVYQSADDDEGALAYDDFSPRPRRVTIRPIERSRDVYVEFGPSRRW
jgi:hypothetical protein